MKLKDRIPDKATLDTVITSGLAGATHTVQEAVGHLESEYIRYRRQQAIGVLIIAAAFLVPNFFIFLIQVLFTGASSAWSTFINIIVFIASLLLLGSYGVSMLISGIEVIRRFHRGVDKVLFTVTFELLGLKGHMVTQTTLLDQPEPPKTRWGRALHMLGLYRELETLSPEAEVVVESLRQSELITEPFNQSKIDALFNVETQQGPMSVSELDIKHVTGSGKNRRVRHIFKGYFVSIVLPKLLEGKTFISTEGDTTGFGHQTFWNAVTRDRVAPTKLEWNDFEALLHVASNKPAEARYVLTPAYMQDLYEWWRHHSVNIRISFIGSRMCLLFPDREVRFHETVKKLTEDEVEKYLQSIATPLMHCVHVVEDVRL